MDSKNQAACVAMTVALLVGCGGDERAPVEQSPDGAVDARPPAPDAYDGELATLSGRVWMPNLAPGLAPEGEEIPVFNASIYVSRERPAGIPPGVYCERCQPRTHDATHSVHDGSFELAVAPGTYWLVIEKAQFRLEQQITVGAEARVLTAAETTLPSTHDPENGQWIPSIAVASGTHDWIEDILGKIRLGSVDTANRYTATNGDIDVYDNGHPPVETQGTGLDLVWDMDTLRRYHIIFFPCSEELVGMLDTPRIQENLRRYVMEGGKIYATDLSRTVIDVPFPPQMTLGGGVDSTGTYDPADPATGELTNFGSSQGVNYTSFSAAAADADLNDWLRPQRGPSPVNPTVQPLTPDALQIPGNWTWINALTRVRLGDDRNGDEVFDTPTVWVDGPGGNPISTDSYPLTVTFEPTGCGRVLYSTYHTTGVGHPGLYPQERILLYLIFELGTCAAGPIVD